jgi:hypothetical protein
MEQLRLSRFEFVATASGGGGATAVGGGGGGSGGGRYAAISALRSSDAPLDVDEDVCKPGLMPGLEPNADSFSE